MIPSPDALDLVPMDILFDAIARRNEGAVVLSSVRIIGGVDRTEYLRHQRFVGDVAVALYAVEMLRDSIIRSVRESHRAGEEVLDA